MYHLPVLVSQVEKHSLSNFFVCNASFTVPTVLFLLEWSSFESTRKSLLWRSYTQARTITWICENTHLPLKDVRFQIE